MRGNGHCYGRAAVDRRSAIAEISVAQAIEDKSQAPIKSFGGSKGAKIAYMPPATEFNYYIAIGEGVKDEAAKRGITTFMLASQSGADINGQMGMIQDVINQKVAAIILSTHDEHAAAPLVNKRWRRVSRSSSSIPISRASRPQFMRSLVIRNAAERTKKASMR